MKGFVGSFFNLNTVNSFNCSIGKTYPSKCEDGKVCSPVEGNFCTVCDVPGCNKFC